MVKMKFLNALYLFILIKIYSGIGVRLEIRNIVCGIKQKIHKNTRLKRSQLINLIGNWPQLGIKRTRWDSH